MTSREPLLLESGDLSVCPERGEVRNARGESTRLGPVNMKVLALLMSRAGQVVARTEIIDAVWPNQLVADDVLTRSISDIRAEVNRLSERKGFIETFPKRGYRWAADVRRASASPATERSQASPDPPADTRPAESDTAHTPDDPPGPDDPARPARTRLLDWAARGAVYAVALVLIATAGVWLMERLAPGSPPAVAVLPVVAEPAQRELAARIEQQLSDYLIGLDGVDVLARSAVESRPDNPFPYFYYEFGASWIIEAALRRMSPDTALTIELVDARTGIVLFQSTAVVDREASPAALDIEEGLRPLAAFFESRGGRLEPLEK